MRADDRGDAGSTAPTIMIVDDSSAIRRILNRILTEAGYRAVEAVDGLNALDACRSERPDLMLLDVDMPGLDGPGTLRAMKADPELAAVPVLFLTARTGAEDVAAGLDLGANDYLRKPCEPAELTARVSRALRAKAQQDVLTDRVLEMNRVNSTDVLTGLGNRRRIEATIEQVIVTHGADADTAVIMIDVDHFKDVNDTYGHVVGDEVLRHVAERLRRAVHERVALARWGGEEFLVAGIGLDAAAACALADLARQVVCATPFAIRSGVRIPVTVSAGCAVGPAGAFDTVLAAADAALYEAKRAGRNRVIVAHPPTDGAAAQHNE